VSLNLRAGVVAALVAGALAAVGSTITYKTQVAYPSSNGHLLYKRVGQEAIKPCKASGASAATPQTVPGFVGTVVGGLILTVWSESSEVAAAPTSSRA